MVLGGAGGVEGGWWWVGWWRGVDGLGRGWRRVVGVLVCVWVGCLGVRGWGRGWGGLVG